MQAKRLSIHTLLALLIAALILSACGRDAEPTVVPPTPLPAVEAPTVEAPAVEAPAAAVEAPAEATDISEAQPESPLQPDSPLTGADSPLPTPTPNVSGMEAAPSDDAGSVTGRLYIARSTGSVPMTDLIVGLAEILVGDDGTPRMSGYDPATPNRATTDAEGGFVIDNVAPGLYTVILDAVTTAYQLSDPGTTNTIIVEVEAGEVFDLGNLHYDSLPLPGFSEPQ